MSGSKNPSNSPSASSLSEEHTADEACKLANSLILKQFQNKLKKSPTMNLSPFLKRQAATYDQIIANLTVVQKTESHNDDTDRVDPSNERHGLLLDGSPEVIYPLDDRIVNVSLRGATAVSPDSSSNLPRAVITGLNEAIRGGEVLWQLHNTFVIGLGSSEAVKISPSIDNDEIDNLNYLNSLSLGIPMPLCFGTLKSGRRTYFFMSRASGQPLETAWPQLTTHHKISIQEQLMKILYALRSIPPPMTREETRIGSFVSGTCKDMRRMERVSTKPIHTETDFNDFLCHQPGRTYTPWIKMVQSSMKVDHDLFATHGDLLLE